MAQCSLPVKKLVRRKSEAAYDGAVARSDDDDDNMPLIAPPSRGVILATTENAMPDCKAEPQPDSDEEDSEHHCRSLVPAVMARRNQLAMQKHNLEVKTSVLNPAVGLSLFTTKQLKAGVCFPVKGPTFQNLDEARQWAMTGMQFNLPESIYECEFSDCSSYKVGTGIGRFINSPENVMPQNAPNARFELDVDSGGLGVHSLVVRITKQVRKHGEILATYGAKFSLPAIQPIQRVVLKKVRRKRKKADELDETAAKAETGES